MIHICLDPGHGGDDRGTHTHGIIESQYNLLIAKTAEAMVSLLPDVNATLTRCNEFTGVTLAERGEISRGSDLVISLHVNADESGEQHGAIPFILHGDDGRAVSRAMMRTLPEVMRPDLRRSPLDPILAVNEGWTRRAYNVLKPHDHCTAVLFEVGFASHAGDRDRLLSKWGRSYITAAIVAGVCEFSRIRGEVSRETTHS